MVFNLSVKLFTLQHQIHTRLFICRLPIPQNNGFLRKEERKMKIKEKGAEDKREKDHRKREKPTKEVV